jgi:hypothetical protein
VAVLLSAAMWIWVEAIAVPHQVAASVEYGSPRGNLSDLYPRWLGARELLLHHRDPYHADVTREIQIGYYGRPLDPNRPHDPKDQQGFAYPIYVVLILAPAVTWSFATVHRVVFWLFAALTALSVPLWLRTLGWQLSRTTTAAWILTSVSCFPAIQGLKLLQLSVLVAALISASTYAIASRQLGLAGILLALATIKPQLVFLIICFLFIWTLGNWRERQRLVWSFALTMAVLVSAGELLLPGWITEFRTALKNYYVYTGGGNSLAEIVLSPIPGRIGSAVLACMALALAWRNRYATQESLSFQWTLCFTLATTLMVIPMFAPYNQLLLLPGVMMVVRARHRLWAYSFFSRFFCSIAAFSIAIPFFSAAVLVAALAFLPSASVQKAWGPPFCASFAIPITMFGMLVVFRKAMIDQFTHKIV